MTDNTPTSDNTDFDPNAFLEAIKAADAQDLKNRISRNLEARFKQHGADTKLLNQILFSESTDDPNKK